MNNIDYSSDFEPKRPKRAIVTPSTLRHRVKPKPALKRRTIGVQTPHDSLKCAHDIAASSTKVADIKLEFPHGSIVSINGRDLDFSKYKMRVDSPTFYGVVDNIKYFDDIDRIAAGQSYISFVLSGEYE